MGESLYEQLKGLNLKEKEIRVKKDMLIEKSLVNPDDARDVVYATQLLEERQKGIYFAESLEQITDILCSLKED